MTEEKVSLIEQMEKIQGLVNSIGENQLHVTPDASIWSPQLVLTLGGAILLFALIVFGFMAYLLNKNHDETAVLRICALPLIIVSAIFLVVVGYSQQQIAPVMGLLGTIAGYLLGNKK